MQRRSPSFYRKRRDRQQQQRVRTNERIRIPRVLVIDENDKNLGEMDTRDALAMARVRELDLVEVQPKARPPIVKFVDHGQYQYEQEKHKQKQKTKQKKVEIKGLRISLRIGKHDLETRHSQAQKFLEQGHKIKIELILRGRERAHLGEAKKTMEDFANSLGDIVIEQPFSRQGGRLSLTIARKS
jgi:translation initiation factor IF-3